MTLVKINRHPSARLLRQFGLICFVFLSGFGAIALWRGSPPTAIALWIIAVTVVLVGGLAPLRLRVLYLLLSYVALPVGFVVGYLSLAMVYFLVITPIGVVLQWTGHDAMSRKRNASVASYWSRRPEPPEATSYYRQF